MTESGLDAAILKTLKYSDHFNFPLTQDEIYTRLIGIKTTPLKLNTALKKLRQTRKISKLEEYYFLPGRKIVTTSRLTNSTHSFRHSERAKKLAKLIALFPTVLAIFITGSLAVNNSNKDDDIDLMIITKSRRLWTTRLLLTLFISLLFLRRTPNSRNHKGKLCLNLYLTPDSLFMPKIKHSLYSAYELIQAAPIYDPQNLRAALLFKNAWISKFLPNYMLPNGDNYPVIESQFPPSLIESLSFKLQLAYMRRKITREYITLNSAFFHPDNPSPKV